MVNEKSNIDIVRGNAAVLAIGTANPPNCINQSDYSDYYFRITNSENLSQLKQKFNRICDGTQIRKRHFYVTEELLKDHPELTTFDQQSLEIRNPLVSAVIPETAKEAANKALKEWGQPRSKITHLIFHTTTCCIEMPGPDCHLASMLGLSTAVNRFMLYNSGCYAGGTVLRLAKDIAENNPGARVLAVCSESTVSLFRGPSETCIAVLMEQALFGDGAAALIVGSDPDQSVERPLYSIVSARQTFIPNSIEGVRCRVTEVGLIGSISKTVPMHIRNNIGKCLTEALAPIGITDVNSLFWMVHPGGKKILDEVEEELKLEKEKLNVTRHVLSEYGNMESCSVLFVMDEMRKRSVEEGKATTGEGAEFGVLLAFGPGLTVETVVLRALATTNYA